ncbi:MAG: winged helix family transcriptional regulator, partial [Proteobacteria bacterium]
YRLRQKIEAAPTQPRLLVTERGSYRLDASVMPADKI